MKGWYHSMSTISCSEKDCAYQKDGRCNLNGIKSHSVKHTQLSGCFYYRDKREINPLKNGEQNPKK